MLSGPQRYSAAKSKRHRVSILLVSRKDRSWCTSERSQVTSVIGLSTNDLLPNME